jgi:hypothetical protein
MAARRSVKRRDVRDHGERATEEDDCVVFMRMS